MKKHKKTLNKKEIIIYSIIVLFFVSLSLLIGFHHEPWADEAHAWLIARDTSFHTLFFKYLHTDGHPALWHLILKFFQFLKLPYKYIFIIPIIISTIGVIIFEFKSKFPLLIKILIPFTYFIFFQYTTIARGYCLLFPILCSIATIWDERYKKPLLFTILLFLLINTEAYTYIFAGMIYLFYLYDVWKNKDNFRNKKHIISLAFLFISFIVTLLYVYPVPSNTFKTKLSMYFLSDSFITSLRTNDIIKHILSFGILLYVLYAYTKSNNIKNFKILFAHLFPVYCFYIFFYNNIWHFGIIFLLFLFLIWIQKETDNKYIIFLLLLTCLIQCYWNIRSCTYDFKNNYTGAKEVAKYLKQYDCDKLTIYGVSFYESAINPYFDHNIFDNWQDDIGFFYWNKKNKYYDYYLDYDLLLNDNTDMVISSDFIGKFDEERLKEKYNIYRFEGYSYVEDTKFENQTYVVYVSKNIDVGG